MKNINTSQDIDKAFRFSNRLTGWLYWTVLIAIVIASLSTCSCRSIKGIGTTPAYQGYKKKM